MKIQTVSIVVGSSACNAKCPFCVAKMTSQTQHLESVQVHWRNFGIACKCAEKGEVTTVLLTGQGEPTLSPELIFEYLRRIKVMEQHGIVNFPFKELQTNGILLMGDKLDKDMREWYNLGLTTIAISAVHWEQDKNQEVYGEKYPNLPKLIQKLHAFGFSVRLSVMLLKGYIDTPNSVMKLAKVCKDNKVEQLTVRPINTPNNGSGDIYDWTKSHTIDFDVMIQIAKKIAMHGDSILELPHGATIYDLDGQNICLSNCLTTNKSIEDMRQIIFFPNGRIAYDWCYEGATML